MSGFELLGAGFSKNYCKRIALKEKTKRIMQTRERYYAF